MKRFVCDKLSAEISDRQCALNYRRAQKFSEREYFSSPLRKKKKKHSPQWGVGGFNAFCHPNIKKCQGCPTGATHSAVQKVSAADVRGHAERRWSKEVIAQNRQRKASAPG